GPHAMTIRRDDADRVRSIPLFAGLSAQHFQSLLKAASLRYVARRTILFHEGKRPIFLYTLIEGSVELFSVHHQRRCTIGVIRSVKPCVLTSIICDRNPVSAWTLERSQFLLVPAKVIRESIKTDVGFASAATHELADDNYEV